MPDQAAATNSGAQHATPEFLSVFGDAAVLGWSLRIRWLMAAAILGVGALLTLVAALSAEMLLGLVVLAAVVGAYNLLFTVLLHLAPLWDSPRALRRLRWLQVPPDVVIFTIALHLSGGIRTPLPILYAYFIVVSIVMAPRGGTYVAAGVATLCYSVLVLLEATVLPPPANPLLAGPPLVEPPLAYVFDLLTRCGAFWIVAFVADMLSRRIQAGEGLIHRQLEDLTLLYRFSDNLSTAPTLDKALDYIVYELGTLLKVDSCSLMLMNEHGQAEFRAAMGIAPAALAAYREHPLDKRNPLLAAVLSGGSGVFAPDVDAVDGLRAALIRPDTRSFYSFPLRAEDKIVGLLNLSFNRSLTLQPSTYDLIVACSRQAGMAIERTLLYQDAHRSAREMRSLYDIGLATSSSLEINSVLDQIADQVQAVLAPDSLVLVLYDAEKGLLEYVIQRDQGTEYPREILPLNEVGASGWIVRNQKPLLIRKWDQEVPALGFVPSTLGDVIQSYLGVPLVAEDRVIGVISVQKVTAAAYDEDHLRLFTAIAAQAALALENARLHEATRQQAQRDSLTGAFNHAALLDHIDHAVAAADAGGTPVALIMLDIDLFKGYNDSYGHVAGDIALKTVVRAITQNVKRTDCVGRWGGEEFGVLLPGATGREALAVAHRIQATLATLDMPDYGNRRLPVPTVSQGIAAYPETASGSAQLVDRADSALYQAKAEGRNAIVTWAEFYAMAGRSV